MTSMPVDCLPDSPDLEQLKTHAKTLRDLVRAGIDGAIALVREHHPRLGELTAGTPTATAFKLANAQLTVARHYDFASWAKLRDYVLLVNRLTRSPHEAWVGGPLVDDAARADELLRLGCLNYGADHADRWAKGDRMLVDHPHLAGWSVYTAAATGTVEAMRVLLANDPTAAVAEGGPFGWPPLLYLTYSRLAPSPASDPVAAARLLLAAGADPNSGYLWVGLPSPFTALTGVFGRGQQGAPPHANEMELARLLLDAGAEANDSQTIYNRGLGDIARDDTEFLELLLDHGLGRGDGGPWRRMLAHGHQTPAEIVADALQHAAEAGLEQRVRLLLTRGVDPNHPGTHPGYEGRTPWEGAVLHGNLVIAELLAAAGADTTTVDPLTVFVGTCLAGDRRAVDAALAANPQLLALALEQGDDLVARAVELERSDAVRLLVDLGFDVNVRHRTTALHEAAARGDLALTKLLVQLGADPDIVDTEWDSPPAGWARHSGHTDVADYLDTFTRSGPDTYRSDRASDGSARPGMRGAHQPG
jgi:hypothetical protein